MKNVPTMLPWHQNYFQQWRKRQLKQSASYLVIGSSIATHHFTTAMANELLETPVENLADHIDYIFLNCANDDISIDSIRHLDEFASLTPQLGKQKVCCLHQAHQLTQYSMNALLKMLEEPSESTVFILTSNNPNQLLKTITSRCIELILPKPTYMDGLTWLRNNNLQHLEWQLDYFVSPELLEHNSNTIDTAISKFDSIIATFMKDRNLFKATEGLSNKDMGDFFLQLLAIELHALIAYQLIGKELPKHLNERLKHTSLNNNLQLYDALTSLFIEQKNSFMQLNHKAWWAVHLPKWLEQPQL